MGKFVQVDPGDAAPIWRQIEDGVRQLAASGNLSPGEMVPSVRELAKELRVNPATVAKAYQRLRDDEVLIVKRGEGTFINHRPDHVIEEDRTRILDQGAERFVDIARTIGATCDEAVEAVERIWDTDGGQVHE